MSEAPIVVAVVAAFKRPEMLAGLLASLTPPGNPVAGAIVVDNAGDAATRHVTETAALPVQYVDPGANLSCGGGVARALQEALKNREATHFWILDDDAKALPGAMEALLAAMRATEADAAVPIVLNERGYVAWPPGLLEQGPRRFLKVERTPEEYLAAYGTKPVPFSWCPWPSLMVSRRAIEVIGFPRGDFWISAEDLEFSLRITGQFKGIFVPAAQSLHLPPASADGRARRQHYLKFCSMLQNLSYVGLHLRHGHRILRSLPGNFLRLFRTFGLNRQTLRDTACAFWRGAVRRRPAGTPGFTDFRERYFSIP